MKKLGLVDDTFLRLESRRQPLHIGVLMLFEPPAGAGDDFAQKIADRLRESTQAEAPFNRRLEQVRGLHYWVEDEEFDLAHHFVHIALPQPGRIRELLAMVSRVHCAHLDRAYPLWRMYLIEGLEDGRIAVYLKIHHAMVDGVGGMRMLLKTMSPSAQASRKLPAPWEVKTLRSSSQPLPVPSSAGNITAARSLAREGIKSLGPVVREIASTISDLREHNADLTLAGQAPVCLLNAKVTATRRFVAQSYSTQRMRAVADAYGATLNDVALAMCGGALRRYLSDVDTLPEKPLTAAVPVSVRRDEGEAGNEVAFTITTLATDIDDPVERMRAIKRGMDYNKERMRRLSPGQLMAYTASMLMPGTVKSLLPMYKDTTLANVVISHVPGPRRPMYWQGARLCGLYPASLIIDGGALNITLVSREDCVDFGLIACRKSLPQMQRLIDDLEAALVELEDSLKPRRRSPPRRAAAAAKTAAAEGKAGRKGTAKGKAGGGSRARTKGRVPAKSKGKAVAASAAPTRAAPKAGARTPAKVKSGARPKSASAAVRPKQAAVRGESVS